MKPSTFVPPAELAWAAHAHHQRNRPPLTQQHCCDDEAAGDGDSDQRQQVAQQNERVLVHTNQYRTIVFIALEEVWRTARAVFLGVSHGVLKVYDKNGDAQ